jgi:RNA polymerase-interacting CarD/CdnL/TRCF family regulator
MNQLHTVLLSTLLSRKVSTIAHDVRGLAQMIEEEPDLSEHERAALLRATRRMLAEADAVLGWISQAPMSGVRN